MPHPRPHTYNRYDAGEQVVRGECLKYLPNGAAPLEPPRQPRRQQQQRQQQPGNGYGLGAAAPAGGRAAHSSRVSKVLVAAAVVRLVLRRGSGDMVDVPLPPKGSAWRQQLRVPEQCMNRC